MFVWSPFDYAISTVFVYNRQHKVMDASVLTGNLGLFTVTVKIIIKGVVFEDKFWTLRENSFNCARGRRISASRWKQLYYVLRGSNSKFRLSFHFPRRQHSARAPSDCDLISIPDWIYGGASIRWLLLLLLHTATTIQFHFVCSARVKGACAFQHLWKYYVSELFLAVPNVRWCDYDLIISGNGVYEWPVTPAANWCCPFIVACKQIWVEWKGTFFGWITFRWFSFFW